MKKKQTTPTMRWQIIDPEHPHFPKHGAFSGELISVFGKPMAKMALDDGDECFVEPKHVQQELRRKRKP